MDIKLPHQLLTDYLKTTSSPRDIAKALSLCGPTVDRLHTTPVDSVYDIEVITNRIDSVSAFGVAREAAAILPQFELSAELINSPYDLKLTDLVKPEGSLSGLPKNSPINFQVLDARLLPRLTCIALKNITVKDSPQKTINILNSSGLRPLNNVVDISNELTLRFGLPVHIFDLDKIIGQKMILRASKKGEKITTLDGKTHTLKGDDIVIADQNGQLIDLCGVMGGEASAVNAKTQNVLLFVPTYDPASIRKTSLYTQNRSLAAQIYEKKPDSELSIGVLVAGVKMLMERAGAEIDSNVFDYYPSPKESKTINLTKTQLDQFVGLEIATHQVENILKRLGFSVKTTKNVYQIGVPSWRDHDIDIWPDLVEEITRVYGYFRLPKSLPLMKTVNVDTAPLLDWELLAKKYLTTLGFTEVLTSSLVKTSDPTAIKLQNPLSDDYSALRVSLIPNLIETLKINDELTPIKIYELSNVYLADKILPHELSTLTLAFKDYSFREAKGHLEVFFMSLGVTAEFIPLDKDHPFLIKTQTAQIKVKNKIIGFFGVLNDLKTNILMADINFENLSELASPIKTAVAIPQYASVYEDVTLESKKTLADLIEEIKKVSPLIIAVEYLSSLENKHTFHLEFNHPNRNLTQKEVNTFKAKLLL